MNHPLTWIDVHLDRLVQNYHTAQSLTKAEVTCVLKANAYGHGLAAVGKALQEAGCRSFAVSCGREALSLRQAGIQGQVLVMTPVLPEEMPLLIPLGITLTAVSPNGLANIGEAARQLSTVAQVDIKVDTGFHRLGISPCPEEAAAMGQAYRPYAPYLSPPGLYSHLGLISQERDMRQHESLLLARRMLEAEGIPIREMHLCDSIGLVRYPDFHHDRVRVGALLYGVRPFRSDDLPFVCLETLSFHATVTQVRHVPAGEPMGYGEMPLARDAVIATVSAGYGDGYPRHLSNGRGQVLIRNQRAPVAGLICMDQMMVDVSHIQGVAPGDTATLLGEGISYLEMSQWGDTNRNECLARLSARPIRRYWKNGELVHEQDDLLMLPFPH